MQIEEAIKLLEEFKKNGYSMLYIKNGGDRNKTNLKIEKAIENLLKRYKELEEEKESYRIGWCNKGEELEKYKNNSIPISVIQNKLEKYKREFDFYAGREHFEWQDGEFDGEQCDDIALKIGVLKELLEERNK